MYMPGFNPSDELLYQIIVSISTAKEPISDYTCLWPGELSDKHLNEVTTELFDEE